MATTRAVAAGGLRKQFDQGNDHAGGSEPGKQHLRFDCADLRLELSNRGLEIAFDIGVFSVRSRMGSMAYPLQRDAPDGDMAHNGRQSVRQLGAPALCDALASIGSIIDKRPSLPAATRRLRRAIFLARHSQAPS